MPLASCYDPPRFINEIKDRARHGAKATPASGIGHSSSRDFGRPYAVACSPHSAEPGEWRPWSSSALFLSRPPANASPDFAGEIEETHSTLGVLFTDRTKA